MTPNFLILFCFFLACTTCAFDTVRYSNCMEIEKELPSELSTCHEVILVQSVAIKDQKKQIDLLKQENDELNAAFKKLLAGNRREKYINPDQKLLEFPEDKELQAAFEAAKREAEQEVEKITYTRAKQKKEANPSDLVKKADSFPAHLRREEIVKPLSEKDQSLVDSTRKVVRQLIQEVLCYKKTELFVKAYYQEMLNEEQAIITKKIIENLRAEIPAGLGEQGRFDASVAAAIACGKFELHIPYYRLQDMFAGNGWTPSRSTLDYTQDLLMEAVEELPKLMIRRVLKSRCIGMDDTGVTLIMPKEIPEVVQGDLRTQRLIEKMLQANRHDLDVQMYLEDVATHLNRGIAKPEDLLPDVWKLSHPEAVRHYRSQERREKPELARLRTASRIAHA